MKADGVGVKSTTIFQGDYPSASKINQKLLMSLRVYLPLQFRWYDKLPTELDRLLKNNELGKAGEILAASKTFDEYNNRVETSEDEINPRFLSISFSSAEYYQSLCKGQMGQGAAYDNSNHPTVIISPPAERSSLVARRTRLQTGRARETGPYDTPCPLPKKMERLLLNDSPLPSPRYGASPQPGSQQTSTSEVSTPWEDPNDGT